jgi:hypothetical protein
MAQYRSREAHGWIDLSVAFTGFLLLISAYGTANAESWQGRIIEQDSLLVVENPREPIESPRTIELEELWRLGGESEEETEFFGVIVSLLVDDSGDVYLLDQALNEIRVFSPKGKFLRTIGREGEGPGEFRRPEDMAFLPGNILAVMERVPGRIVLLTQTGEPAGEHPLPEMVGGGFVGIAGGASDGRNLHLVLGYDRFEQGRYGHVRQVAELNQDGTIRTSFAKNDRGFSFADPLIRERVWDDFENRWDVGSDGGVYVAMSWDEYLIEIWSPAGEKERIVKRPIKGRKRSREEIGRYEAIYEPFVRSVPSARLEMEKQDHPIVQVYARDDGWFWVLSCHGAFDRPDGSLGTFDAFDREGRFVRQITLMGEGDPLRDAYVFVGKRLYILKGLLDAQISAQGGASEEAGADETEPMSVICYRLDS